MHSTTKQLLNSITQSDNCSAGDETKDLKDVLSGRYILSAEKNELKITKMKSSEFVASLMDVDKHIMHEMNPSREVLKRIVSAAQKRLESMN